MHSQLFEDVVGISKNIHQVGDRCALITRYIRNTGLQKRLRDRKDPFSAKLFALAEIEFLDFLLEEALCHSSPPFVTQH